MPPALPTDTRPPVGSWRFDAACDPYVTIIGRGRSGTNLALDVLDTHPRTICRSEANRINGAALNTLPLDFEDIRQAEWSGAAWRAALETTAYTHSARDRSKRDHKSYYRSLPERIFCERVLPRRKLRVALKRMGLLSAVNEWRVDWAFSRAPDRHPQLPVFKILTQPHWILRTHAQDPGQHVIHVVRDPAGFIPSWMNRYVAPRGGEKVHADNLATLDIILERLGGTLQHGRAYSEAALIESELWRWRYMNDTVFMALSVSERYRLWRYEEMIANPAQMGGEAMAWLGLDVDASTRQRMSRMENTLFAKPHAKRLDTGQVGDIAAAVLEGSPMADWFGSANETASEA